MRLRVLTAAVVAAWSKTAAATTAAVLPGVLEQPAGASVTSSAPAATSCDTLGPYSRSSGGIRQVSVDYKGDNSCTSGTMSLQFSANQTDWKTLASQHENSAAFNVLSAPCVSGNWWYRGFYVTDDGTFKGTITPQEQITC